MAGNSTASQSILYYLLFDPAAPAPADPRPGRPLLFVDPAYGRVLARTDWTPEASWFDYLCGWETINHQLGDCNQFELWRKGEWLVKERSGYSNDFIAATSDYHDTLAVQNDVPENLQWYEGRDLGARRTVDPGRERRRSHRAHQLGRRLGVRRAATPPTSTIVPTPGWPRTPPWTCSTSSRGVVWL